MAEAIRSGSQTTEFRLAALVTILQVLAGIIIFWQTRVIPPELLLALGIPSGLYSVSRGQAKKAASPG
ncbi:MAG: hypothetical protein AABY46_07665 [Nitrospirota bacterium]